MANFYPTITESNHHCILAYSVQKLLKQENLLLPFGVLDDWRQVRPGATFSTRRVPHKRSLLPRRWSSPTGACQSSSLRFASASDPSSQRAHSLGALRRFVAQYCEGLAQNIIGTPTDQGRNACCCCCSCTCIVDFLTCTWRILFLFWSYGAFLVLACTMMLGTPG